MALANAGGTVLRQSIFSSEEGPIAISGFFG
jgi:hypothetical protein